MIKNAPHYSKALFIISSSYIIPFTACSHSNSWRCVCKKALKRASYNDCLNECEYIERANCKLFTQCETWMQNAYKIYMKERREREKINKFISNCLWGFTWRADHCRVIRSCELICYDVVCCVQLKKRLFIFSSLENWFLLTCVAKSRW